MKILVVIPSIASYLFLREFCKELALRGWDVHLATSWSSLGQFEEDKSCVTFHAIDFPRGMNPISHFHGAKKLNEIVRNIQPDVVDVHFSAAAFTAALARKRWWPPTIATVQGLRFPLAEGFQATLLKFAECWSAKKLNKYIVLTSDDLAALQSAGVKNCVQQEGFGFGCDLERFDRRRISQTEIAEVEKEIGKRVDDTIFVFIGRLVAFKGFHLVFRAFLKAYAMDKSIKLLVCGEFDELHESGLTADEIGTFKSHKNVIFTGWTDRIESYLSVSDVVVFPSEREGVPVNLMEALSMGVPVITCDSRGCREVMNNGGNGILLKARDSNTVAQAMLDLAGDQSSRLRYSASALEFREKFDRGYFIKVHISLIHKAMGADAS